LQEECQPQEEGDGFKARKNGFAGFGWLG